MASDFKQKEPSKNEKMFYEIFMQMQGMERSLFTNSAHIIAMGIILGVEPEKVAQIIMDNEKIKDYSAKINEAMKKLQEKPKDETKVEENK
jgi:uncharacterized membrane protein (DUF106 family)